MERQRLLWRTAGRITFHREFDHLFAIQQTMLTTNREKVIHQTASGVMIFEHEDI